MASQAPQNALQNPSAMAIANQHFPDEGPKAVPLGPFNFSTAATYNIDLTVGQQQGRISVVQNLFIDNAGNTSNCVVTCQQTGQSITAAPLTQGFYPILAAQPIKFQVTSAGSVNFNVVIYAINVPIAPAVWSAISGAGALLTQPVSDAIVEGAITNNRMATLEYLSGNADVVHAQHVSDKSVVALITTAATTTLLTGAPSFFLNALDIALSGNATLASAGTTTFSLQDSNGPTIIWEKTIWLPNAALTTTPVFNLGSLAGLNWNSKGNATNLLFIQSTALNAGTISVNLAAGTTADQS